MLKLGNSKIEEFIVPIKINFNFTKIFQKQFKTPCKRPNFFNNYIFINANSRVQYGPAEKRKYSSSNKSLLSNSQPFGETDKEAFSKNFLRFHKSCPDFIRDIVSQIRISIKLYQVIPTISNWLKKHNEIDNRQQIIEANRKQPNIPIQLREYRNPSPPLLQKQLISPKEICPMPANKNRDNTKKEIPDQEKFQL